MEVWGTEWEMREVGGGVASETANECGGVWSGGAGAEYRVDSVGRGVDIWECVRPARNDRNAD